MQKSGDLLLKLKSPLRVAHGCSIIEEVPLNFGREIVPLKNDSGTKTPQNTFFSFVKRAVRSLPRLLSSALTLPTTESPGEIIQVFANFRRLYHGPLYPERGAFHIPRQLASRPERHDANLEAV